MDYRFVFRAKLILALADGGSYRGVADKFGSSTSTVSTWKKRFLKSGIAGLRDAKRSGAPRTYTDADRARVIQLACEKPTDGYTNHSQRRIAEKLNMSKATVNRILQEAELKPHKTEYWCGKSPDPEFESKMLTIVGLYLDPPKRAIVICADEKTQIQALDRTQPELPMMSGNPRRQTVTYKRHGTVSLMAALAVHTGEITSKIIDRNTAANFLCFLKQLDRKYRGVHLHVIVDNLSIHKQKDVKEWLSRKRKFTIHYTPTYSSWLNQAEIFFNILTRDVIKGGIWPSRQALVKQIVEYIDTYNKTRKAPFAWTYDGTKSAATASETLH